ncbi:MAG TPA: serine/threonine-protein kinase, partial [Gemmataceae bacterium]|nr:serine/threonine-protein kinase [Gemmataceae bacterium]
MTEPNRPTVSYHERLPAGARPEHVRVAVVGRSGPVAADDLYPLLRRRLLVYTTFFAVVFLISFALSVGVVVFDVGGHQDTPAGAGEWLKWMIDQWRGNLMLVVSVASVLILWYRPPASVRGLRGIELLNFALLVGFNLHESVSPRPYGFLVDAADMSEPARSAFVGRYANAGGVLWFIVLTTYGALIPNTWRRSAVVCGVVGMSPLVLFAVYSTWVRPLPPDIVLSVLTSLGFFITMAVSITVFSTSRIEYHRRLAAAARKLGQYVLKEKLGAGGMGEVYRAEHALLRRPCALKLIRPEKAGDPAALRRFEREVQVTATLTHPNTVQIFDYGHAQDGTFYYVMEYLPGLTLDEIVRRHGPLPPARAVHFLRQVCAALAEAHARGLTHRDIKPGNVMVCERGGVRDVVKLLDFGLVLPATDDPDGATLTREGVVAGTPAFMSPEQAGGQDGIDPRSDLYSVGALAYFLLTGKPPFDGRPAVKTLAAHLYEAPPALPADVPPALAAVVTRCLAKAPAERWSDSASLEAALGSTTIPAWTADDAAAWWRQDGCPGRETGQVQATATWVEQDPAPGPAC